MGYTIGMPSSLSDRIGLIVAIVMFVVGISAAAVYTVFYILCQRVFARTRVPPLTLSDDVNKAIAKFQEKTAGNSGAEPFIMLPSYGKNTPAVRRRLVLASNNPSHYNTYFGNRRIKLAAVDAKQEGFDPVKNKPKDADEKKVLYGFFHPYANCGGGGERVLWAAVKATLEQSDRNICVIYTGIDPPPAPVPRGSASQHKDQQQSASANPGEFVDINRPERILERAKSRFGLEMSDPKRIVFIYLANRKLVDPTTWPRFTLLLQALGSMVVAHEAMTTLVPDVFVDTMGYPFTYPIVSWIADIPIATYVHYPVISTDMIKGMVQSTRNGVWRRLKWLYWTLFAYAYTFVGGYVSIIMTNSTWTHDHMCQQWWYGRGKDYRKHIQTVYPPCATQDFTDFDHEDTTRHNEVVYLAQFRAEKRHELVLTEFAKFQKQFKEEHAATGDEEVPKLVLIGTIRNDTDRSAVYNLRLLAHELKLADGVDYEFVLDSPWSTVVSRLSRAKFGLDAMWNEHFGMVIVEYMAARLVPVVHHSGGPLTDIVVPWSLTANASKNQIANPEDDKDCLPTGFHFVAPDSDPDFDAAVAAKNDLKTLAETFATVFKLTLAERKAYTARGWAACQRFSDAVFADEWNKRIAKVARIEQLRTRSRKAEGRYD